MVGTMVYKEEIIYFGGIVIISRHESALRNNYFVLI